MSEETVVENTVAPEVLSEARSQGWVPKEEFRGPEGVWVDAEKFVLKGKQINPILRKNNEILLKKIGDKDKEIAEIKASVEEFKAFQKEAYQRKLGEYETQISQLKVAKREAVTNGDGDRVVAIDDAIDELKEQKAQAKAEADKKPVVVEEKKQEQQIQIDPILQNWMDGNSWYGRDDEASEVANALGVAVKKQFPHLSGQAFLDKLDERIEERIPEVKGKKRVSQVEGAANTGNSGGSRSTTKKTYENLPSDAKAACDKFVKQKLMTKEDYVSSYDWS